MRDVTRYRAFSREEDDETIIPEVVEGGDVYNQGK